MKQTAVEWLIDQLTPSISLQQKYIDELKNQAKEMEKEQQGYSEKDMIEFAEFVATYPDKNKNINGQILHAKSKYDGAERTIDLLEQFKKNNMKQTAVEWLKGVIDSFGNKHELQMSWSTLDEIIEQAKEMEKEQIIDAHQDGHSVTYNNYWAELYYNETYGGEK